MNLYIVRHAEAVPVGGAIRRDADRPLTPRGEDDAANIGRVLARSNSNIDVIATSTLVRAVRTGKIISHEFAHHPIFHATDHLAPGFDHEGLLKELVALSAGGNVVAVGHQPDVGMFVSALIADSSRPDFAMPPGTIAALKGDPSNSKFHLMWLLTPDLLKSVQT